MKSGNYTLLLPATFAIFVASFSTFIKGENVGTLFKRSDSESSYQDSASEHDSLTPIENTDSAPSDHSRKFATGNGAYHRKMYKFHHQKIKYHQAFGDVFHRKLWKQQADEHYAESASSKQKKIKHKKQYKGILEGNMKPGKKTAEHDAIKKKDFPEIPKNNLHEYTKNDKYVFNKRKGHHYLVGKLQHEEKPRTATPAEQIKSTSTASIPPKTMEEMKHDHEKLKQIKSQQSKLSTSSHQHTVPQNKHHDEEAKVYYGAKTTATTARRLPVQKLGGGGKHSASSGQSSDGNSSVDSLHKPLLHKSRAHH